MKTYLRKIYKIIEDVIGTATVVSPELVINKKWNVNSDNMNNVMKVPSKNFYDYLGLYMCPDEALKDASTYGEGNYGLGLGPYNNDLGLAVDKKVFSSPAPVPMEIIYSSESVSEFFYDVNDSTKPWTINFSTQNVINGKENSDKSIEDYNDREGVVGLYDWKGEWGDIENGFETGIDIQINIKVLTEKVPGGITGDLEGTNATCTVWIGDNGDVKKSTSYRTIETTKEFYNQHFSTGMLQQGNGVDTVKPYYVRINRKPYETKLRINGVAEGRGGKYRLLTNPLAGVESSIRSLNVKFLGKTILPIGDLLWNILGAFFALLENILLIFFGNNDPYRSTVRSSAEVVGKRIAALDKNEIVKHPAYKYFQTPGTFSPISYHAYLYTQFYYPFFNLFLFIHLLLYLIQTKKIQFFALPLLYRKIF